VTELGTTRGKGSASPIIAACVIAAGLIGAALIVAHRPPSPATITARAVAPPITQESARQQFRSQVLAAPALHTYSDHGTSYTLSDIRVSQVIYTLKDDTFTLVYDWVWQPSVSTTDLDNSTTFSNDGYGHYFGSVVFSATPDVRLQADVTLR
jgi:hypothetical protein